MSTNFNFQQNPNPQPAQPFTPNVQQMIQPTYQPLFPAPIGNIYSLNTASDINNIPAGNNVSLGLCLQEGIMYIKSYQNGAPMLLGYKLAPLEPPSNDEQVVESKVLDALRGLNERIAKIEQSITAKTDGGKLEW